MSVGSSSKGLRASLGSCLSFKLSISLPCDLASAAIEACDSLLDE